MIYTDRENIAWWNGLSRAERADLFAIIGGVLGDGRDIGLTYRQMLENIYRQYDTDNPLTGKQIGVLRKWWT